VPSDWRVRWPLWRLVVSPCNSASSRIQLRGRGQAVTAKRYGTLKRIRRRLDAVHVPTPPPKNESLQR